MDSLEALWQDTFEGTKIVRRPVAGIVKGWHNLPYVLVGPDDAREGCLEVRGTVEVTPRLVVPLRQIEETLGEMFRDDPGFMDASLVHRAFRFAVARDPSRRIAHGPLRIEPFPESTESRLGVILERFERAEETRIALIDCPRPRFYPAAIDRFIRSVLDREFDPRS